VSPSSILAWKPVYGDRAVHYAECAIGVFWTRTAGRRVVMALNNVAIGNHGDTAQARAQADRLIEATAGQVGRRQGNEPARAQEAAG